MMNRNTLGFAAMALATAPGCYESSNVLTRDSGVPIDAHTETTDTRTAIDAHVEVDAHDPARVYYVHPDPILTPGKPGTFDEDGAGVSCAVMHEGRMWLYYTGYSRCASVPYRVASGVAVSRSTTARSR